MQAEVSQRGQVTIPKSVRDKYGLTHKSEVEVVDLDGSIMIVPLESAVAIDRMNANFDRVRDELIAADVTLDDMMAALQRIRDAG
jgi:AbrB family looped-hinge helix DNA binding protein